MFTLIIRATLIYLIVLIVYRLMGKRQLGQMQPFELVLTLIIADLATIPMTDPAIPILHGIIPLLTLVTLHYFLAILSKKSNVMNKVISGKPMIIINPNGIDYSALQKLNLSVDDLFESIRGNGCFSFDQVEYAIIETNGTINVLQKKETLTSSPATIPISLIIDGKINKENLKTSNLSEKQFSEILNRTKIKKIKDVLILTIDGNGKIYFQLKKGNCSILNYPYKEVIPWKKQLILAL